MAALLVSLWVACCQLKARQTQAGDLLGKHIPLVGVPLAGFEIVHAAPKLHDPSRLTVQLPAERKWAFCSKPGTPLS